MAFIVKMCFLSVEVLYMGIEIYDSTVLLVMLLQEIL